MGHPPLLEDAFVLVSHTDKEYLERITQKIAEQGVMAIDIEEMDSVYSFIPCHMDAYSFRMPIPRLNSLHSHAVLFKCTNESTLIADIMAQVTDVLCPTSDKGFICIIPNHYIQKLKKKKENNQKKCHLCELIEERCIFFDNTSRTKKEILQKMASLALEMGFINDSNKFMETLCKREEIQTTGIGYGIALPHVRAQEVIKPFFIVMLCSQDVDFDSVDKLPVKLVALLGLPLENTSHFSLISELSRKLLTEEKRNRLMNSKSIYEIATIFKED